MGYILSVTFKNTFASSFQQKALGPIKFSHLGYVLFKQKYLVYLQKVGASALNVEVPLKS